MNHYRVVINWGAWLGWPLALYYPMRKAGQMTIVKTHPRLQHVLRNPNYNQHFRDSVDTITLSRRYNTFCQNKLLMMSSYDRSLILFSSIHLLFRHSFVKSLQQVIFSFIPSFELTEWPDSKSVSDLVGKSCGMSSL